MGVPAEDRTLAANTFYMGPDIGMSAGPIISGAIMEVAGASVALMTNFVIGLILLASLIPYSRWKRKTAAEGTPR